ncbi:hypothetical protein F7725_016903 [Dissostichus mawsoni]|uniref:Uncharacterized protein n=1 Tax=Dissostichus mawsoni TaxID=36200 RepID=A0A7J5Z3J2_DISMA|nr:hypothetical protein F7725_016903 [Dissostichus mawsoni]
MEDTLTCSHATFSQVFGRQGQLMHATAGRKDKTQFALMKDVLNEFKEQLPVCSPRPRRVSCVIEPSA